MSLSDPVHLNQPWSPYTLLGQRTWQSLQSSSRSSSRSMHSRNLCRHSGRLYSPTCTAFMLLFWSTFNEVDFFYCSLTCQGWEYTMCLMLYREKKLNEHVMPLCISLYILNPCSYSHSCCGGTNKHLFECWRGFTHYDSTFILNARVRVATLEIPPPPPLPQSLFTLQSYWWLNEFSSFIYSVESFTMFKIHLKHQLFWEHLNFFSSSQKHSRISRTKCLCT